MDLLILTSKPRGLEVDHLIRPTFRKLLYACEAFSQHLSLTARIEIAPGCFTKRLAKHSNKRTLTVITQILCNMGNRITLSNTGNG